MRGQIGAGIQDRPHPQERENGRQPVGEGGAVRKLARPPLLSPLPGGEGQGEGERMFALSNSFETLHRFNQRRNVLQLRRGRQTVAQIENMSGPTAHGFQHGTGLTRNGFRRSVAQKRRG